MRRWFYFICMLFFVIFSNIGYSQTFNVSTPEEFHRALKEAATNHQDDIINVEADMVLSKTLTYSTNDGDSGHDLTINGNGHVLDGNGSVKVMIIDNDNDSDGDDGKHRITIKNVSFINGKGANCPGLLVDTYSSYIYVENCVFSNNKNPEGMGWGGNCAGSHTGGILFVGNTFSGNSAFNKGGGLWLGSTKTAFIKLIDNLFVNNSSEIYAGGVYIDNTHSVNGGPIYIARNTFIGNSSGHSGGGIVAWAQSGSITAVNNVFYGNSSTYGGGAAFVEDRNSLALINNTFVNNTADKYGGGALVSLFYETAKANIYNNIFWGNNARKGGNDGDDLYVNSDRNDNGIGSSVELRNNDLGSESDFVTGNSEDLFIRNTDKYDQSGNIKEDPKLAAPLRGDFHLKPDSPCLDKGNLKAPGLPQMDFEGESRISGEAPDIGADEVNAERTFYVSSNGTGTKCSKSNPCAFQYALTVAQSNNADDTINILSNMKIRITLMYSSTNGDNHHTLTINGLGHVLYGSGLVKIMNISTRSNSNSYDKRGDINIVGLKFVNGGGNYGGGVAVYTNNAKVDIDNCAFSRNMANYGGGIYISTQSGDIKITKSMFLSNSSAYGGGIDIISNSGIVDIINNVFSNNRASWYGGGLYAWISGKINFINNTLSKNNAKYGGGVNLKLLSSSSVANLYNNILWHNSAGAGGYDGDDLYIDVGANNGNTEPMVYIFNNDIGENSDFDSGQSEDLVINTNYLNGNNITYDPEFVNRLSNNFHLLPTSPCIDAGKNNTPSIPNKDIEGRDRIINGTIDIGAYEYQAQGPAYYSLNVTIAGSEDGVVTSVPVGINCGSNCSATFASGTEITLTTVSGVNSKFVYWGDNCSSCGINDNCTITLDNDTTCLATFSSGVPFPDVSDKYWAYKYIVWAKNKGITTGYPDGTYKPENPVKRGEMAAFIIRALEGEPQPGSYNTTPYFSDVHPDHWAFKYVQRMKEKNIASGYSGTTLYGVEDLVTREQMAKMLVMALVGEPPDDYCSDGPPFPDVDPSGWSCEYIKKLKELGITKGYPDGTYRPKNPVTRAEMATFLFRTFVTRR